MKIKHIDIYNLSTGGDLDLEFTIEDDNGYPVDLAGASIVAVVKQYVDSETQYDLAAVSSGSPETSLTVTIPEVLIGELAHFLHTYYVFVDDELAVYGLLRPDQEYHNQLVESASRSISDEYDSPR